MARPCFVVAKQLSVCTHELHCLCPVISWMPRMLPFLGYCVQCPSEHNLQSMWHAGLTSSDHASKSATTWPYNTSIINEASPCCTHPPLNVKHLLYKSCLESQQPFCWPSFTIWSSSVNFQTTFNTLLFKLINSSHQPLEVTCSPAQQLRSVPTHCVGSQSTFSHKPPSTASKTLPQHLLFRYASL